MDASAVPGVEEPVTAGKAASETISLKPIQLKTQ